MRLRVHSQITILTVAALCTASCAYFDRGAKSPAEAAAGSSVVQVSPEDRAAEAEAKLRSLVRGQVEAAGQGEAKNKLIKRHPYYLKEYEVFPDGSDSFELMIQKTESRTAPFTADVTLKKLRFSTRLHRDREEALNDGNFLRDTGDETRTYELRNGKWTKVGSFFVAGKTEENVNGEWVPVQEEVKRTVAAEEQRKESWFQKGWSWVTGR